MKIKLQLNHEDKTVTELDGDSDLHGEVSIIEYENKFFVYGLQGGFSPGVAKFWEVSPPFKIES